MNARNLRSEAKSARYVKDEVRKMKHNTVHSRKWDKQWVTTCPATSLRLYKWVPVKEPLGGMKKVIKVPEDLPPPQEMNESPNEETTNKAETQDVEEMLVEHKQENPSPVSSHGELREQPTPPPIDPTSPPMDPTPPPMDHTPPPMDPTSPPMDPTPPPMDPTPPPMDHTPPPIDPTPPPIDPTPPPMDPTPPPIDPTPPPIDPTPPPIDPTPPPIDPTSD